jgi:hypothetical protein
MTTVYTIESYVEFLNNQGLKATLQNGKIDVTEGSIWPELVYIRDGKIAYPFGRVAGGFNCAFCDLESLEGAPEYVEGDFVCIYCYRLTSLRGAPARVGNNFNCSFCDNLISLEGAPRHVENDFACSVCDKLQSLEGAPEYVGGNFFCFRCPQLTSLRGLKVVAGRIYASEIFMKDFAGFPKEKIILY